MVNLEQTGERGMIYSYFFLLCNILYLLYIFILHDCFPLKFTCDSYHSFVFSIRHEVI